MLDSSCFRWDRKEPTCGKVDGCGTSCIAGALPNIRVGLLKKLHNMKKYLLVAAIGAFAIIIWIPRSNNNVCKTFDDYYSDRDSNRNCYYNPDAELSVPEIVRRNGYPIEIYEVVTLDGYILTVFRIPHGKYSNPGKRGQPVFLQHGIHLNSGSFVNIGNKSLAFILADEGYDVWLGNARGSKYSLNHLSLNYTTDPEFWNFSLHECGKFDLQAEINMVHTITSQKIIYIGYSMGTASMYIYSATYPDAAYNNIKLFISLAPSAFHGEEYFTAVKFLSIVWDYVEPILRFIGKGVVFSPYFIPVEILKYLCLPFPFQMKLCLIPHLLVVGSSFQNSDPETLPITLIHHDKASLTVWSHYTQLFYNKNFEQFDYGEENNLKRYGIRTPPKYNLTQIKVPMYFIRAVSDILITEMDVNKLYKALPENNKPKDIHIVKEGYGHFDLITAKDVASLVYKQVIKIVNSLPQ